MSVVNDGETSNSDRILDIVGALRDAADLWRGIISRVEKAREYSRIDETLKFEQERRGAERLLDKFEDKIGRIAKEAAEWHAQRPSDPFYPWLEDRLLRHEPRDYYAIRQPKWYMGEVHRNLEALRDRLPGVGPKGDRQRLNESLEKAGDTIKKILATPKNPPAKQRGRRRT